MLLGARPWESRGHGGAEATGEPWPRGAVATGRSGGRGGAVAVGEPWPREHCPGPRTPGMREGRTPRRPPRPRSSREVCSGTTEAWGPGLPPTAVLTAQLRQQDAVAGSSHPWQGSRCGHVPGIRYALQGDLAGPGQHAAVARGDHDDGGRGFGRSAVPCGDKAQATECSWVQGEDWARPSRGTGCLCWDAQVSCPTVTPHEEAWGALSLAGAGSLGWGGPQPIT